MLRDEGCGCPTLRLRLPHAGAPGTRRAGEASSAKADAMFYYSASRLGIRKGANEIFKREQVAALSHVLVLVELWITISETLCLW